MIIKGDIGLSKAQTIQRNVLATPNGSCTRWAARKIDYYEKNQIIKVNMGYAKTMQRIIVFTMPIFAFLDIAQFGGKLFFHAVTLNPKLALHDLYGCLRSHLLFLLTIPLAPVACANPISVYRTKKEWENIMSSNFAGQMKHLWEAELNDKDIKLKSIFKEMIDKHIKDPVKKEWMNEMVGVMLEEVEKAQGEKKQIVGEEYLRIFALLTVKCATGHIPEIDINRKKIATALIEFRDPELRITLLADMLNDKAENSIPLDDSIPIKQCVPIYLLHKITSSPEIHDHFKKMLNNHAFREHTAIADLSHMLYDLLDSDLSKELKERALLLLMDCYDADLKNSAANKEANEAAKPKFSPKKLQTQKKNKEKLIKDKEKRLQELGNNDDTQATHTRTQLQNNIGALKKEISAIDATLEELKKSSSESPVSTCKFPEDNLIKGMRMVSILSLIDSQEIVQPLLDKIGHGKSIPMLSDQAVMKDTFNTVFNLDEATAGGNFDRLWKLRAPWAFIKMHLRLKETKNSQDREALLKANTDMLKAVLKGNFCELRMCEEDNPHLRRIFLKRPELKAKWNALPTEKVDALNPHASIKYRDFTLKPATDPTDIMLMGNDMRTCVNLDGRIQRVQGLLGYVRDGKTQTIVAKKAGDDKSYAEMQLQLLWDAKNQKRVLFCEQVNYDGNIEGDRSLNDAMVAYAKKRAEEFGLDLVAHLWCNAGPGATKYEGNATSLGSSAPIEYVNGNHRNERKKWTINEVKHVSKVTHVSKIKECRQVGCMGATNKTKAMEVFNKIKGQAPQGIKFNKNKITGHISGGNCSALAFGFIQVYLNAKSQISASSDGDEMPEDQVEQLLRPFERGCNDDIITYRSIQLAFNSIEVDRRHLPADVSAAKVQSLANYYDFNARPATNECDLVNDGVDKMEEETAKLTPGIYLLRVLAPKDNERQEDYGHTMVYIKTNKRVLFYDPTHTAEYVTSKLPTDHLYPTLLSQYNKWQTRKWRFYSITPKDSSVA